MFSTPFDSCTSLYENPSSNTCFLMNFPTSLLDDEELLFEHLLHHQSPPYNSMNNNSSNNPNSNSMDSSKGPNNYPQKEQELGKVTTTTNTAPPGEGGGKRKRVGGGGVKKQAAGPTGRRRTGKKDRHSKIYTAQGPRDRRMRLSLQIARKFFDLQDMLGFDKASKTIEWLFSKSKSAIRELTSSLPPHQRKGSLVITNNKINLEHLVGANEPKINAKPGYSNPVARESREKARARARQRTIEKKKHKELMLEINPNNNNNVSKFGSSSTPETVVDQEDFNSQPQQSVSIIEKLLGSDSSASSSSIYDECSYLGFTGNWVTDSLRMYPSYGAITGVDELQVILQQQNPKSVSSGTHLQSPNQLSSTSRVRNLL